MHYAHAEIVRLYAEERRSVRNIAAVLHVAHVTILDCLRCAGVPRRGRGTKKPNRLVPHGDSMGIELRRRDGSVRAVAVVDAADAAIVAGHTWTLTTHGYVATKETATQQHMYLHQLLLPVADALQVDHVDGDKLNNRRSNLRDVPYSKEAHAATRS